MSELKVEKYKFTGSVGITYTMSPTLLFTLIILWSLTSAVHSVRVTFRLGNTGLTKFLDRYLYNRHETRICSRVRRYWISLTRGPYLSRWRITRRKCVAELMRLRCRYAINNLIIPKSKKFLYGFVSKNTNMRTIVPTIETGHLANKLAKN